MNKEAMELIFEIFAIADNDESDDEPLTSFPKIKKLADQALALFKQQTKALDFAISCGAMGKGDDSCCGVIYWSADGKLICNECGTEYFLVEQQPPAGEFTKECRRILRRCEYPRRIMAERKGSHIWSNVIWKKLDKACGFIDREKALNEDLLTACEIGLRIAEWICERAPASKSLAEDTEAIRVAIAKAHKK